MGLDAVACFAVKWTLIMSSSLQPCGHIAALAIEDVLRELRDFANAGATLRQHTVKKLTGGSRLRGATLGLHFGAATSGSRAVSLDVDDFPGKRLAVMFAASSDRFT